MGEEGLIKDGERVSRKMYREGVLRRYGERVYWEDV